MGPTRFGFCCCERGPLNVFTMSISIHPLFSIPKLPSKLLPRPSPPEPNRSLAMFRDTHMGSVLAQIGPLSVRRSSGVGKLLDRNCDATPDSRPSVIALRYQLLGRMKLF